ncbi:MAG: MFS transporter [Ilumatobacteraceae bacterium]
MTDHDLQRSLDSSEAGTESAPSSSRRRPPYRWVAMGVVLFGTFMVVLDTTIINLGLPSLNVTSRPCTAWSGSSPPTSSRSAPRSSPAAGPVTDSVGGVASSSPSRCSPWPRRCAPSPRASRILVLFRILQGVGGGLLMPIAMAMVYELFEPSERGRALGCFGIAVMAAPAIGPVLGGTVVSSIGWRWLFLINVPIGLIGTRSRSGCCATPATGKPARSTARASSRPDSAWWRSSSGCSRAGRGVGRRCGSSCCSSVASP